MIRAVPLKAEHLIRLIENGIAECGLRASPNEQIVELAQRYESEGFSVTLMNDADEPMMAALITPLWQGVANVAALLSVQCRNKPLPVCRAAKKTLLDIVVRYDLWRLQTTVRTDFETGQQFAEWLGFKKEGVAVKHTHDKIDSFYYAWVR